MTINYDSMTYISNLGPIMVLVASITNKKKRKENTKKERKEEREI